MYRMLPGPENDVIEVREDWSTCTMYRMLGCYLYLKTTSRNLEKTCAMYRTLPDLIELREDWNTCAMYRMLPIPENDVMELRGDWSTCAMYPYLKSAS